MSLKPEDLARLLADSLAIESVCDDLEAEILYVEDLILGGPTTEKLN
jgi:hypothetical protein